MVAVLDGSGKFSWLVIMQNGYLCFARQLAGIKIDCQQNLTDCWMGLIMAYVVDESAFNSCIG